MDDYGRKNMMVLNEFYGKFHIVFALAPLSPYKILMDSVITQMLDFGLINAFLKQAITSNMGDYYSAYSTNAPEFEVLRIEKLSGAFIFLFGGCSLALIVFCFEMKTYIWEFIKVARARF